MSWNTLRYPRTVHLAFALALLGVGVPRGARAADAPPIADRVGPEALAPEPLPHQLDLALGVSWTRVVDRASPDRVPGLTNLEVFGTTTRVLVGSTLAYCAGVDAHVGGSDTGAAYGATAYVAGLGVRGRNGSFLALCGGAGGDRVVGSVPWGFVFPAELLFAFEVGPLRPVGWARAAWVAGAPERRDGSPSLSFVDELEVGIALRIGEQHRYWKETNAGGGPSIGVVYSEFMGTRAVGVALGLAFSGGQ